MERYLFNLNIAWHAIKANYVRSILTALGIIFGVAAVIAMLAIGNGTKIRLLEQMEVAGVNNIEIISIFNPDEDEEESSEETTLLVQEKKKRFSPGLNMQDVAAIEEFLPTVKLISPEIELKREVLRYGKLKERTVVGVTPAYFEIKGFQLAKGKMFSDFQLEKGEPVCILGDSLANESIGQQIKCGTNWLTVVGVLEARNISDEAIKGLNIRNYDLDLYVPIQTALLRFDNRAISSGNQAITAGGGRQHMGGGEEQVETKPKNYHQLDKITVRVHETAELLPTSDVINRMIQRRHYGEQDFQITIPEIQLKQQEETEDRLNFLLGAIAGISLLVGGIGIMNIMLASVMERIKEIGVRLSIGAKKTDIVLQFLFEAVLISLGGGIIGILLGVGLSVVVENWWDTPTVISISSVILSFVVSVLVGLFFGIYPAQRAAAQDPIKSLRND
jgi:putative ABC transport system permease protein